MRGGPCDVMILLMYTPWISMVLGFNALHGRKENASSPLSFYHFIGVVPAEEQHKPPASIKPQPLVNTGCAVFDAKVCCVVWLAAR